MKNFFLITIYSLLISSCTTVKIVSSSKLSARSLKLKSDKRLSYFIYDKDSNRTYTLSEPPPDAILEKTVSVVNNVKVKDQVDIAQKMDLASKVIQLGERTVAVNILRDALFRLSEMNINNRNKVLEPGYKALFDSILSASKSIALTQLLQAQTEKENAETKKIEAETKKAEAEIQLKSLNPELSGYDNYQAAMKLLLSQDKDNSIKYLEELYKKYPNYFNIDKILYKLKKISKNKIMNNKDWIEIYEYILNGLTWKIDTDIIKEFKDAVNKNK